MSTWTHVNASIRFDLFRVDDCDYNNVEAIKEFIGPMKSFIDMNMADRLYDYKTDGHDCTLPMGSEGSLRYTVYNDDNKYINVNFFGDLRDYDSEQAIVDYFNELINRDGATIFIRSGIVSIGTFSGVHVYEILDREDYDYDNDFGDRYELSKVN